jgi:hypothetical protein
MARDRGSLNPYELLADLAAAELELVKKGEYGTVSVLHDERRTLVSQLPAQAPSSALGSLERAAELQRETSAAIAAAIAVAREELTRFEQGRTVVQAYTPTVTHSASVDYTR